MGMKETFETIKMFTKVKIGQNLQEIDSNEVLKELYNTFILRMYLLS